MFFVPEIDAAFEPLRNFAGLEKTRVKHPRPAGDENGPDRPKHLRTQDLHSADSAVELPDAPATAGLALRACAGGDLVGYPGN
jgi:type I restriction enzyme M protein